jgi:glycosyltransferase involved in cell wall biosynthesis
VWRGVRFATAWERLTRRLLRDRPDLILFSTIRFPFQAVFLRRLRKAGLRLAQICHEFEGREAGSGWTGRIRRRLAHDVYRSFEVIFFHGEAHRSRFLELFDPPARLEIIPHGNQSLLASVADAGGDLRERYRIEPGRPVAVFFGGLRPSKGIPDLLEAFAEVVCDLPEAALVIAGPPVAGTDLPAIRDAIEHGQLGRSVTLDARYLPLAEIGPLLRTGDVVALPYRSGTASGVLQAAYAFGRPVITTDVGSLAEAVDEGATGLVVPPGDPAALVAALTKLLGDRRLAARMGETAAAAARERYSWEPIARRVLDACRRDA